MCRRRVERFQTDSHSSTLVLCLASGQPRAGAVRPQLDAQTRARNWLLCMWPLFPIALLLYMMFHPTDCIVAEPTVCGFEDGECMFNGPDTPSVLQSICTESVRACTIVTRDGLTRCMFRRIPPALMGVCAEGG